jgi:hypothetical protein
MTAEARAHEIVQKWACTGYGLDLRTLEAAIAAALHEAEQSRASNARHAGAKFADAAECLWGVVCNVSYGDWTKQAEEWQQVAARGRALYFAALGSLAPATDERSEEATTGNAAP